MTDITTIDSGLIDIASRGLGLGGQDVSTFSVFNGLNVLGGIPALPHNTDNQGFVFFTKPCMNLSYNNVIGTRKLAFLADNRPHSMGNVIRCMLNPHPNVTGVKNDLSSDRSKIIDDKLAYLPISNLLLRLTPPPDTVPDIYTSSEGYSKQQVSWIDGKPLNYSAYDLTAEFANMEGDPISTLFAVWIEYAQRMSDGSMFPFPINLIENRIDYQTRIYHFVLDKSKTYIQKWWASGASFPTSNPDGAPFGYTNGQHLNLENNEIQITFRCLGSQTNDPILLREFNATTVLFNPDMSPTNGVPNPSVMTKVYGVSSSGFSQKALMNYKLYPWININTSELEWYCPNAIYNTIINSVNSSTRINQNDIKSSASGYPHVNTPWTDHMYIPNNSGK